MKKLMIAMMLCTFSFGLMAQVGVKAGVNFTNMVFDDEDTDVEDLARNGATKFTLGVEFILPLTDAIALQPELLFSQKGAESSFVVLGQTFKNELTYNYIDLPIMFRFSLGDSYGEGLGLYLNAGGYGAYALSGKTTSESPLGNTEMDLTFDEVDDQKRLDYGIVAGGGLTLGNLFFEVRYLHGINNLLDDDADNSNDNKISKYQHRGVGLNVGIIF